jgi:hypothetical protein
MSAGRRLVMLLAGLVVAILAGASLGRALAPDDAKPTAPAIVVRPASPDPALRPVLDRLDRARFLGRRALGKAHTAGRQAVAAQRLSIAHRRAAAQLDAPPRLLLLATARAYAMLADAASAGSTARYVTARRAVSASDADLARAVDEARRPPAARAPAQASAPPTDTGSAPLPLVLLGFAATALVGLFAGTAIDGLSRGALRGLVSVRARRPAGS